MAWGPDRKRYSSIVPGQSYFSKNCERFPLPPRRCGFTATRCKIRGNICRNLRDDGGGVGHRRDLMGFRRRRGGRTVRPRHLCRDGETAPCPSWLTLRLVPCWGQRLRFPALQSYWVEIEGAVARTSSSVEVFYYTSAGPLG